MPSAPRRLVIATHNRHKTEEFRALLGREWQVDDLTEKPGLTAPDETGATFEENATLKALAAVPVLGPVVLVVADDSGLEVDALDGRPGVHSARYAGPDADDGANRRKVLAELAAAGARGKARTARFRCVLVVARGGETLATFDGTVEGLLTNRPRGRGGFGYDSLFLPEGRCQTFAELPAQVKNALSHRARAAAKLIAWLRER